MKSANVKIIRSISENSTTFHLPENEATKISDLVHLKGLFQNLNDLYQSLKTGELNNVEYYLEIKAIFEEMATYGTNNSEAIKVTIEKYVDDLLGKLRSEYDECKFEKYIDYHIVMKNLIEVHRLNHNAGIKDDSKDSVVISSSLEEPLTRSRI